MQLHIIESGNFKLDGGAMFGVVPKSIWQRTNPADDNNQIDLAARCLLIETRDQLILVDTGMGDKQSEKFFSHYGLWGDHSLEKSILEKGFHPDQITDVLLTHLHFDHVGGAVLRTPRGELNPRFKNAKYWTSKEHWDWAMNPNLREKASFLGENLIPLKESGQLCFIGDNTRFPFELRYFDGHTEKQVLPLIPYRGKKIFFTGDLIATAGHLPIAYVMSFDMRPLLTLKEKSNFLEEALKNDYLLLFEHDAHNELISLKQTEKGIRLNQSFQFNEYFE
jgi:glyoxylase-like metal-dependent hydrolase (beta-lactamase superfamily II)